MSLVLHDNVVRDVKAFVDKPPHALLLTGSDGVGKRSIAEQMVTAILERDIGNYPYLSYIEPDNGTIKVDAVRDLRQFLRLKLPVKADGIRRFVIIEHADTMSLEAQNALLKTLEEPPVDTLLILTTASEQALAETILSRVQRLNVLPPTREQLLDHFMDDNNASRAYMLSGGLPGLMTSILTGDDDNDLVDIAETAREILTIKPYDRLKTIDKLAKSPSQVTNLIAIISRMATAALESGSRRNEASIRRWHAVLKSADEAEASLARNAQTKLVLLNLFLSI